MTIARADFRQGALRHQAKGIFVAEQISDATITNSRGRIVPVRLIGEQYVREDLGRIPSFADWVRRHGWGAWGISKAGELNLARTIWGLRSRDRRAGAGEGPSPRLAN